MLRINGSEPLRVRVNGSEVDSVVVHKNNVATEVWSSGFTLHIATIANVSFSVRRTASPKGGRLITLTDGARIYEGDKLSISTSISSQQDLLYSIIKNGSNISYPWWEEAGSTSRSTNITVSGDTYIGASVWKREKNYSGWSWSGDAPLAGSQNMLNSYFDPIDRVYRREGEVQMPNYQVGDLFLVSGRVSYDGYSEDEGMVTNKNFDFKSTLPIEGVERAGTCYDGRRLVGSNWIWDVDNTPYVCVSLYVTEIAPNYLNWEITFPENYITNDRSSLNSVGNINIYRLFSYSGM